MPGLVYEGLVMPGLVMLGLVIPGLVMPSLVISGLVISGLVKHFFQFIHKGIDVLKLPVNRGKAHVSNRFKIL